MRPSDRRARAADYGIDAPGLVRGFIVTGLVAAAACAGTASLDRHRVRRALTSAALAPIATYALGMGTLMLVWRSLTKVRERETILDRIGWRGDETVLDVGCGRGLMLVAAARRTPRGSALGIDIWRGEDQSGNLPAAAVENARREGVAERVAVETADMRRIPHADASFDVVVSHWVVHNLEAQADRATTLAEMLRVLRPDGRLVLADIANHGEYLGTLTRLGADRIELVQDPLRNRVLRTVSFGSFEPATIYARKGLASPAAAEPRKAPRG